MMKCELKISLSTLNHEILTTGQPPGEAPLRENSSSDVLQTIVFTYILLQRLSSLEGDEI